MLIWLILILLAILLFSNINKEEKFEGSVQDSQKTVYTRDYYPWWRSTRWWNYDGWLYQRPYYNYWRRPYYYNYWFSGSPLNVEGEEYYARK